MRELLNVIHFSKNLDRPCAVLSVDAEKAFDRVSWCFLGKVLRKLGFGDRFMSFFRALYSNAKGRVLVNGLLSSEFQLYKGTRQGCPMSPYFFDLSVEVLAAAIRQSVDISGIVSCGVESKLLLYADDMLVFLSNLESSIPALADLFIRFGLFSNFKVNWDKTEVMPLSTSTTRGLFDAFPVKWSRDGFKYLGIDIVKDFHKLMAINIDKKLVEMRVDCRRWEKLNLTIWGKMGTIKMTLLPKLLYIFHMVPLPVTKKLFQKVYKVFSDFLWGEGKRPKIPMKVLFAEVRKGGFGFPDLERYHRAFTLRGMHAWLRDEVVDSWDAIERGSVHPDRLDALLNSERKIPAGSVSPLVLHTVKEYKAAVSSMGEKWLLHEGSSLWDNPSVVLNGKTIRWRKWIAAGVFIIRDIWNDGALWPFDVLKFKYKLDDRDRRSYAKLGQIFDDVGRRLVQAPSVLRLLSNMRVSASCLYKVLRGVHRYEGECDDVRLKWSDECAEELSEDEWARICEGAFVSKLDLSLRLIRQKVIWRIYWCPVRLEHLGLAASSTCWACDRAVGSLYHMLWDCIRVRSFWAAVWWRVEQVLGFQIKRTFLMVVLGAKPVLNKDLTVARWMWINRACVVAIKLIMRVWKSPLRPKVDDWVTDLGTLSARERITSQNRKTLHIYDRIWGPFNGRYLLNG